MKNSLNQWHIVGDVHGNVTQLKQLMLAMDYKQPDPTNDPYLWQPPDNCKLISLGDLVDRGPDSLSCLLIVKRMHDKGYAELVLGNHEWEYRKMIKAQLSMCPMPSGIPLSRLIAWTQLLGLNEEDKIELLTFIESRPRFLETDDKQAIIVHARWEEYFRDLKGEEQVLACACGYVNDKHEVKCNDGSEVDTSITPSNGIVDLTNKPNNIPKRAMWTSRWRGPQHVYWGHQVISHNNVTRIGHTTNLESGCFKGGNLSAITYPNNKVFQIGGAPHWRKRLKTCLVQGIGLFPRTLSQVANMIKEQALDSEHKYIEYLQTQCNKSGGTLLLPELNIAHSEIYKQCIKLNLC